MFLIVFFSCKFWDSENLPVSSIRYTRGGGQISQDSIFTFPKVAESSLNLRLALRQKKKQLRTKDLWFYISLLMIITKGNNDLLRFENQLRHLLPPVDAHCPGPPSHNHSIDICWKPCRQTMIFQHDLQQLHKSHWSRTIQGEDTKQRIEKKSERKQVIWSGVLAYALLLLLARSDAQANSPFSCGWTIQLVSFQKIHSANVTEFRQERSDLKWKANNSYINALWCAG